MKSLKLLFVGGMAAITLTACLGRAGDELVPSIDSGPTISDTIPPTISLTSPGYAETGVPIDTSIVVTFSEPMNPATVTSLTFTLDDGTAYKTGAVTYAGTSATFSPLQPLANNTTYRATITTGVKDIAGNAMPGIYTWTFTTSSGPDTTLPTVLSASPASNATNAAINAAITVTFREVMDASTVTAATFTLSDAAGPVAGTVIYSGTTATFTPSSSLEYSAAYTATIAAGVMDAAGNAMASPYTWNFTTGKRINNLSFRAIDAEYSKALDKIIMVSSTPGNQLHIYDPVADHDVAVNLSLAPSSVSVSPDGLYAAVGHNAWVSYVDLSAMALLKTIPVTADISDIVLAGNGYIYAFPRTDQWVSIHAVNIATEVETLSSGWIMYAGTKGKLHPGGTSIYGADNGLSPSDIEKFDISGGIPVALYDSPYHGDYQMCGDLWMSEEGLRIFTRCGNVFRASSIRTEDMTYNGALENLTYVRHLTHSAAAGKVVAIPDNYYWYSDINADTEIRKFAYDYLTFEQSIALPHFIAGSNHYAGHGRFVFYNSDGSKYFVVLQADSSSGMLYDFGVIAY